MKRPISILIITAVSISVILIAAYLVVFGRALTQPEDHVSIMLALPSVMITSVPARVGDSTYLSKDAHSFIEEMGRQGFRFVEQLGAGYVFDKDDQTYILTGHMYSSHFMIFSRPEPVSASPGRLFNNGI